MNIFLKLMIIFLVISSINLVGCSDDGGNGDESGDTVWFLGPCSVDADCFQDQDRCFISNYNSGAEGLCTHQCKIDGTSLVVGEKYRTEDLSQDDCFEPESNTMGVCQLNAINDTATRGYGFCVPY